MLYDFNAPIWASNTVGRGHSLVMQCDNNPVDYSAPVWVNQSRHDGVDGVALDPAGGLGARARG